MLCTKLAASCKQWPSIDVISRIMVPSKYQMSKNCGSPWSGNIDCSIYKGSGAKQNIEGLQHKGNLGVQSAFLKDVQSLTVVIQDMDNPLLEERNYLLVVDTKYIMESVDGTVMKVNTLAMINTASLSMNCCQRVWRPVTDPLPKNKRSLFSYPAVKGPSEKLTVAINEEWLQFILAATGISCLSGKRWWCE